MKRLLQGSLIALCLLLTLPCCAAKRRSSHNQEKPVKQLVKATSVQWEGYNTAVEQSKKDHKFIGLFFTGSDWCIWCTKMEEQILSSPEFTKFSKEHLHMVEVDFPQANSLPEDVRQQNQTLKTKYGVNGFPTLVFIDGNGTEKARMGFEYGGGENYVKKIKAALNKK